MQIRRRLLPFLACLALFAAACRGTKATSDGQNRPKAGRDVFAGKSERDRLDFNYNYFNGAREKVLGNAEEAARYFAKALRILPVHPAANYELSSLLEDAGQARQALPFAEAAAKGDPANKWYSMHLAEVYERLARHKDAAKTWKKLCAENPEEVPLMFEWADALIEAGDYSGALEVLEKIERKTGISEDLAMQKQKLYLRTQKLEKAVEETKKLVALKPGEVRYYNLVGELYSTNGQYEKAMVWFQKALAIDPTNPFVRLSLADYYRNQNQKANYFKELKLAVGNASFDLDAKVKYMLSFYALDPSDTMGQRMVRGILDTLVLVHPKQAKVFALRGDFQYRDKDFVGARQSYKQAVALDKARYAVWNQLLLLNSQLGEQEDLATHAGECIEYFPNEPLPYLLSGLGYLQKKNANEAIRILKKGVDYVVNNKPLEAQFYSSLGDAYHQAGNTEKSDYYYEEALRINPEDPYVLNNYAYYLSLRNSQLDKAEAMSKKSIDREPENPSYLDTYGWILYGQKRYSDARVYLEKALVKDGNNGTLLEHFGDILFRLDLKDQALDYWMRAKKAGGGSDVLERKLLEKKLIE